jgi:uncharacterized protein YkwD
MVRTPRIVPCLALVAVLAMTAAAPPATAARSRSQRLLYLVNQLRGSHGLVRLRVDADVQRAAVRHSRRMAERRTLFHSTDLESVVGRQANAWGENIAKARRVGKVFSMWSHSAGHRANMLNPRYRRTGIGIVKRGRYLWVTMIFYG